MKKALINSTHSADFPKGGRPKSKKRPSRVKMADASAVTSLNHVLMTPLVLVKEEFPSSSELLMIDELRQSVEASHNKSTERPRLEVAEKQIRVNSKPVGERTGKRRGRPVKNRDYGLEALVCGFCNFKAENLCDIEEHLKIHSNQNVYECPYCSFIFSQKGNLITHIRTHTKEKPFKCFICDFAASQKINLQVHIRTHTKEKPFKCSVCDFSAAQKCNLLSHVTRRHSNVEEVKALETYDNQWGNSDSHLKYYRCGMCMFSCRLKREMLDHVKDLHSFSACDDQTIDVLK